MHISNHIVDLAWSKWIKLKVEYLIICIICDTDLVNKLILQMYTLHKYK